MYPKLFNVCPLVRQDTQCLSEYLEHWICNFVACKTKTYLLRTSNHNNFDRSAFMSLFMFLVLMFTHNRKDNISVGEKVGQYPIVVQDPSAACRMQGKLTGRG